MIKDLNQVLPHLGQPRRPLEMKLFKVSVFVHVPPFCWCNTGGNNLRVFLIMDEATGILYDLLRLRRDDNEGRMKILTEVLKMPDTIPPSMTLVLSLTLGMLPAIVTGGAGQDAPFNLKKLTHLILTKVQSS